MKLVFVIHSTYDAFLAERDQICFTANPKGARRFNSYYEAEHLANRLERDKKLTGGAWIILAIPTFN
jgi:hypothetical protein